MTIRDFIKEACLTLYSQYGAMEARAVANTYVRCKLRMLSHELVLHARDPLTPEQETLFLADLNRLYEGCPVQYILKETEFYSRTFEVTPAVLIPRPETEELVLAVCQRVTASNAPVIWDVGTGSGCIAVSLACELPQAKVYATDISEDALHLARRNAQANSTEVCFAQHDMTDSVNLPFGETRFDVLVSNPPYIPEKERARLARCVRAYEPEEALFVPDHDPLIFYRALAELGRKTLNPNGLWATETYEDFHEEMAKMLNNYGYRDIESLEDINGRRRMMIARNK